MILLIDDDIDFCKLCSCIAQKVGVELEFVGSVAAAELKIKETTFQAFIVDGILPDGTGLDVIKSIQMRQSFSSTTFPIAFISNVYRDSQSYRKLKEELKVNYVFNKPVTTEVLTDTIKKLGRLDDNDLDDAFFDELKKEYNSSIIDKLELLQSLIKDIKQNITKDNLKKFKNEIHKIGGSAGNYGYPQVSKICFDMEQNIIQQLKKDILPNITWISSLQKFNEQIKIAYQIPIKKEKTQNFFEDKNIEFFIIDDDLELVKDIKSTLENRGIKVGFETDINQAVEIIQNPEFYPKILCLDIFFPNTLLDGFDLVKLFRKLHSKKNTIVCMLTQYGTLEARIKSHFEGVEVFIKKPFTTDKLLKIIEIYTLEVVDSQYHALVLDDDKDFNAFAETALKKINVCCQILTDEKSLLESLEKFKIDLLILDLTLCAHSGLDILRILRMDYQYYELLIVIVSANNDTKTMATAYELGADDYLVKPVDEQVLCAKVRNLCHKKFLFQKTKNRDPLTGLFNRQEFFEFFQITVSRHHRDKKPFSLVILDIDHFKSINDQHGHSVGDKVLAQFASVMKKQFRRHDILVRWGGEEFVILLTEANIVRAQFVIGMLLQNFEREKIIDRPISFSAGIASFPKWGRTLDELIFVADQALYKAKKEGRKCIRIASKTKENPQIEVFSSEVMIFDSHPKELEMFQNTLSKLGFLVKCFDNKEKLWQTFHQKSHPPILIIVEDTSSQSLPPNIKHISGKNIPILYTSQEKENSHCISKPFSFYKFTEKFIKLVENQEN